MLLDSDSGPAPPTISRTSSSSSAVSFDPPARMQQPHRRGSLPLATAPRPPVLSLETVNLDMFDPSYRTDKAATSSFSPTSSSPAVSRVPSPNPQTSHLRHTHFPPSPEAHSTWTRSPVGHAPAQHARSGSAPPPTSSLSAPPSARPPLVSFHSHAVHPPSASFFDRTFRSPETGRLAIGAALGPWLPVLSYVASTLSFVIAMAFFRKELFSGLDALARELKQLGLMGKVAMGFLIFLTTIPPLPLYSTLIILSGYAFGAWDGFIISYSAALIGAVFVFVLSRSLFRTTMIRMLSKAPSFARVVSAIERKPSLLLAIRVAPYPYNCLSCLLASSRTLTLRSFAGITALANLKLLVHTTVGSTVHNWGDHTSHAMSSGSTPLTPEQLREDEDAAKGELLRKCWSVLGIALCIALFIYLTIVARRAVDHVEGDAAGSNSSSSSADRRRDPSSSTYSDDSSAHDHGQEMSQLELVQDRVLGGLRRMEDKGGYEKRGSIAGVEAFVGMGEESPIVPGAGGSRSLAG